MSEVTCYIMSEVTCYSLLTTLLIYPPLCSTGSATYWYTITDDTNHGETTMEYTNDGRPMIYRFCLDLRAFDTTPGAQVWLYKCNSEVSSDTSISCPMTPPPLTQGSPPGRAPPRPAHPHQQQHSALILCLA